MDLATGDAPRSFSDRVLRLLERVEHRVATDPADRRAAFRLRCEAYQKAGFMKGAIGEIYDPLYDDDPNGWTTMTFVDGELAGTVRINVGFDEHAVLSALEAFHDVLLPKLRARRVIIEFTRLAAKLSLSSLYPELAYVIMRPGFHGRRPFRRRLRRGGAAPRTRRILSAHIRGGDVVRAARLSGHDDQTPLHGRRLPLPANDDRGSVSLLQVRAIGKRSAVRTMQRPFLRLRGEKPGGRLIHRTHEFGLRGRLRR